MRFFETVIVFVTLYEPTGKKTAPLPVVKLSIAAWIASVSSVTPSPFAPKSLTLTMSRIFDCHERATAPVPAWMKY